jgi:hypothetical protein
MMFRKIVLLIGRLFFDPKYMDHVVGKYIVKAALGKVFLAANAWVPWPADPGCKIQNPENIESDNDIHRYEIYYSKRTRILFSTESGMAKIL